LRGLSILTAISDKGEKLVSSDPGKAVLDESLLVSSASSRILGV
jgi:hypothetical protein